MKKQKAVISKGKIDKKVKKAKDSDEDEESYNDDSVMSSSSNDDYISDAEQSD